MDETGNLSRRDFIKIIALASGAAALPTAWLLSQKPMEMTETRTLMGTIVHLSVISSDKEQGIQALEATFTEMERLIKLYDHRISSSPLARLNAQGQLSNAPAEFVALVNEALAYGALTGGAFDVTVKPVIDRRQAGPLSNEGQDLSLVDYRAVQIADSDILLRRRGMQITLDGIAKGQVVDGGIATLRQGGFDNVVVEAGGDLVASGHGLNDNSWRVAIAHPRPDQLAGYIANFTLTDRAVATSGDYLNSYTADKRHHHIIDPRTGESPSELASVSVVASSATRADALSTALMVMPMREGIHLVDSLADAEALFVTKNLTVHRTGSFPV